MSHDTRVLSLRVPYATMLRAHNVAVLAEQPLTELLRHALETLLDELDPTGAEGRRPPRTAKR